jgi:NifU-like protein involved in Fe-S cluster formation
MVSQRLRELAAGAPGAGALDGDGVRRGAAEHEACGDQIEISLRLAHGRIAELRWRASGCPASHAVAAAAATALVGAAPAAAPARLREALAGLGDLDAHERHAEALLLRALARACAAPPGAAG